MSSPHNKSLKKALERLSSRLVILPPFLRSLRRFFGRACSASDPDSSASCAADSGSPYAPMQALMLYYATQPRKLSH